MCFTFNHLQLCSFRFTASIPIQRAAKFGEIIFRVSISCQVSGTLCYFHHSARNAVVARKHKTIRKSMKNSLETLSLLIMLPRQRRRRRRRKILKRKRMLEQNSEHIINTWSRRSYCESFIIPRKRNVCDIKTRKLNVMFMNESRNEFPEQDSPTIHCILCNF